METVNLHVAITNFSGSRNINYRKINFEYFKKQQISRNKSIFASVYYSNLLFCLFPILRVLDDVLSLSSFLIYFLLFVYSPFRIYPLSYSKIYWCNQYTDTVYWSNQYIVLQDILTIRYNRYTDGHQCRMKPKILFPSKRDSSGMLREISQI